MFRASASRSAGESTDPLEELEEAECIEVSKEEVKVVADELEGSVWCAAVVVLEVKGVGGACGAAVVGGPPDGGLPITPCSEEDPGFSETRKSENSSPSMGVEAEQRSGSSVRR